MGILLSVLLLSCHAVSGHSPFGASSSAFPAFFARTRFFVMFSRLTDEKARQGFETWRAKSLLQADGERFELSSGFNPTTRFPEFVRRSRPSPPFAIHRRPSG
jgi:hypothetical protein